MRDLALVEVQVSLVALGWQIEETQTDGRWSVLLIKAARAITSCGFDREQIWNALYLDALRAMTESLLPG